MTFFDSHCHLTAEHFDEDRGAAISRAREAGVDRMVTIASSAEDSRAVVALLRENPGLRGSVGVHPHVAGETDPAALPLLRELALSEPAVVAIGETGFDFFYDNAPRAEQEAWFLRQVELAAELDLPLVVHSRDADAETAAALRDLPDGVRGVVHCFTGGRALLDAALEADWYVSFTGLVSFRTYDGAELLRAMPRERLLIETDSPYLAPVPLRGRRNEPANVRFVCEAVAAHRGEDSAEVARYTAENAERLFPLRAGVSSDGNSAPAEDGGAPHGGSAP
jgi:TatD DNase family protein